ncbi:MAG: bifunctional oligoribonuclease/PAP phosphatase NrnA [Clostridia bacterium]|nr:bifunctional oligoribonuclease/PAP phosphatase NrnA [Clostridia bacterium]
MDKEVEKIGKKIEEAKKIALFTHVNCDCDGIGSMCAMYEYLLGKNKKVSMFCDSDLPEKYKFLNHYKNVNKENFTNDYDLLISLDTATSGRLGIYEKDFLNHSNSIVIDHHKSNEGYAKINVIPSNKSSCGEVLFDVFKELSYEITREIATSIYAAISFDTNQFTNSNVNSSAFYTAGELLDLKANAQEVNLALHRNKSWEQLRLAAYMASHLKLHKGIAYILMTLKTLEALNVKSSDVSDFLTLITNVGDSKITIVIKEKAKDFYRLSMRSIGNISVNNVASIFNGGGHTNAAGCSINGKYSKVIKDVLNECCKEIERNKEMDK